MQTSVGEPTRKKPDILAVRLPKSRTLIRPEPNPAWGPAAGLQSGQEFCTLLRPLTGRFVPVCERTGSVATTRVAITSVDIHLRVVDAPEFAPVPVGRQACRADHAETAEGELCGSSSRTE